MDYLFSPGNEASTRAQVLCPECVGSGGIVRKEWFLVQIDDDDSSSNISHVVQDHLHGFVPFSIHGVRDRENNVDGPAVFL